MMALIGTLTYAYEVSLPLFGRGALHGGPTTYSALFAGFGSGSVVGGVYCTRHPKTGVPRMIVLRLVCTSVLRCLATAPTTLILKPTPRSLGSAIVVGSPNIDIFLDMKLERSTEELAARARDARSHDCLWSIRVRRGYNTDLARPATYYHRARL